MKGPEWLIHVNAEEKNNQLRKQLPKTESMQTEDKPTLNELQRCYSSQRHKGNFLKKYHLMDGFYREIVKWECYIHMMHRFQFLEKEN